MIMAQDLDDAAMKAVRIANIVKQVCFTHVYAVWPWPSGVSVDGTNIFVNRVCHRLRRFKSAYHSSFHFKLQNNTGNVQLDWWQMPEPPTRPPPNQYSVDFIDYL